MKNQPKNQLGLASRRTALEVLIKVDSQMAYANLALAEAFKRRPLSPKDRAFVTALVQGVLRHRIGIDEEITKLSTKPLADMAVSLRNILRMSIFQLEFMDSIPPSAIVNTSTELAKVVGHSGLEKFCNGLLRNFLRKQRSPNRPEESEKPATPFSVAERLSKQYSMPIWLVQRWLKNYGTQETEMLLSHAQKPPNLVLRTCELHTTPSKLEQLFQSNGISCYRSRLVETCIIIEKSKQNNQTQKVFKGTPTGLPGYIEGLFSIQDESAALVSIVVDPQPGELVIDLCAAPGGKSLHLAELMKNKGRVIAVDSHAGRLGLLRKNRNRLKLTNIETVIADGCHFSLPQLADRVLVDAPCSGTGVINRRSDLRYNKQATDLIALTNVQRQLLTNAANMVKLNGVLVYSTCSIETEENFDNISWFLERHTNFSSEDITHFLPQDFIASTVSDKTKFISGTEEHLSYLQLLPSRHNVSGFFICRLRRSG